MLEPIQQTEIVVVGSGVAGSTLAAVLARDGRHVTVIERNMAPPERLNGEIMQPGGMDALRELDLDECILKLESTMLTGFVVHDLNTGRQAELPFPKGAKGYSINNGLFLHCLRTKAQAEKNCTYIEASVDGVVEEDGVIKGITFRKKGAANSQEIRAKLTFVCEGSYSYLRKTNIRDKPVKYGTMVGFLFNVDPPQENLIEDEKCPKDPAANPEFHVPIFFTKHNTGFTYRTSHTKMRFVSNIRADQTWPSDIKHYMKQQINPLQEKCSEKMGDGAENVSEYACVHAFHLNSRMVFQPGMVTIGDALNMRHPVTASGMTVALKDVLLWRRLLANIQNLNDHCALRSAQEKFLQQRKEHSFVINLNARVFHDTVYPTNPEAEFSRDCMFDYLLWSKRATKDIAAILGAKETRPWVLLYHLFMLTVYTSGCAVRRQGWTGLPRGLLNGFKTFWAQATTLASYAWQEHRSSALSS